MGLFKIELNKRQTTVIINIILTQKWFFLNNIKDSSLNILLS
jgi:hypothetical protein